MQGLVDHFRDFNRRDFLTLASTSPGAASPAGPSSRRSFVRGSITPEWTGTVARNRGTFAGPCVGYRKKGDRYPQPQGSSAQRCHAACCGGADGRGCPLQGSTLQQPQKQQQQPQDSSGTFPAEYTVRAATTRSLHQHGHAGYCASA